MGRLRNREVENSCGVLMARVQVSKKWLLMFAVAAVLLAAIVTFAQYRKAAALEDRLDCVTTWLQKAKALHGLHIKDPVNITGDSRRQLMDQIGGAYGCETKEPSHSRIAPGGEMFGMHPVPPH